MKHLSVVLILLCLGITSLFSQESNPGGELSEIRKNKNHIDLDVKNIFNGLGNATILYKRRFQAGELIDVNAVRLIRFSARIDNQYTFTDDPTRDPNDSTDAIFHPSDITDFQIGIGFEKQFMKKGFVHYFGVDAVLNYLKNDDDFSNGIIGGIIINRTGTTDRLSESIRTGLVPFFGIKYYFSSRISVGIETSVSILYFSQSFTEIGFSQQVVNGQLVTVFEEKPSSKSSGIQTKFNNLRFLTVGYTF